MLLPATIAFALLAALSWSSMENWLEAKWELLTLRFKADVRRDIERDFERKDYLDDEGSIRVDAEFDPELESLRDEFDDLDGDSLKELRELEELVD